MNQKQETITPKSVDTEINGENSIKEKKLDQHKLMELVEKNIKWSQVIYHQNRKIQRRLTWIIVGNYVRLLIILIPLILGIIYLPSFISEVWEEYGALFSQKQGVSFALHDYFGNIEVE